MKNISNLFLGAFACIALTITPVSTQSHTLSPSTKRQWDKGTIVVDTPERPA